MMVMGILLSMLGNGECRVYVRCIRSEIQIRNVRQLTGVLVIPRIPVPLAVTDQLDELDRHHHHLSPIFEDEQIQRVVLQAGVLGRRGC